MESTNNNSSYNFFASGVQSKNVSIRNCVCNGVTYSYLSSNIRYSEQSLIPLRIKDDAYCHKGLADLFIKFIEDYAVSFNNMSQLPKNDSDHESEWSEFVRSIVDHPTSIVFVRTISQNWMVPRQFEPHNTHGMLLHEMPQQHQQIVEQSHQQALHEQQQQHEQLQEEVMSHKVASEAKKRKRNEHRLQCELSKCNRIAHYNFPGQPIGMRCHKHREDGMIHVDQKMCEAAECTYLAKFNYQGEFIRRFCDHHKLPGMVRMSYWFCFEPDCKKKAYYNYPGEKVGFFCPEHKKENMVRVTNQLFCHIKGCPFSPCYGIPGNRISTHCENHKSTEMILIRRKRCHHLTCRLPALWILPDDPQGVRYCERHKPEMAVTRRRKFHCSEPGCQIKRCSFHFPGDTAHFFCRAHKKPGMEIRPTKLATCIVEGCKEDAVFRHKEETNMKLCEIHCSEGMVRSRKCNERGCRKAGSYHLEGTASPLYCQLHRKSGMSHRKHKQFRCCEKCSKIGRWGHPGDKQHWCEEHKDESMMLIVKEKKTCHHPGCSGVARYGLPDNFAGDNGESISTGDGMLYCLSHKTKGMVLVSAGGYERLCEEPSCFAVACCSFHKELPRFCSSHKLAGMKERKNRYGRVCQYLGCATYPSYNFPHLKERRFCYKHAEEGMINKSRQHIVQVVKSGKFRLKCAVNGCGEIAKFSSTGMKEGKKYCGKHKKQGMREMGKGGHKNSPSEPNPFISFEM